MPLSLSDILAQCAGFVADCFYLDKLELVGSDTVRYLLQKLKMFEGRC